MEKLELENLTCNQNNNLQSLKYNQDSTAKEKLEDKKEDMLSKITCFFKNSKLKNIKGLKILVVIIVACICSILFLNFYNKNDSKTIETNLNLSNSLSFTNSSAYVTALEEKLTNLIASIKDAGRVKVMITISTTPEIVLATSKDEKTNSSTSNSSSTSYTTTVTEPIIITDKGISTPLVIREVLPEIKGVVVVSSGASNTKVKLDIINAVKALLNISSNNIQVFCGI